MNITTSVLAVAASISVSLPTSPLPVCEPYEPVTELWCDGDVAVVAVEDIVAGCVMGEMPYSFDAEALKAQAVAARTYLYYCADIPGRHPDGDICADAGHCIGYITKEEYAKRYGEAAAELAYKAASEAALATKGEVLTYDGEVILSVWHSSSDRSTEDSGEVWQTSLPYLKPTESSEAATVTEASFSLARVREILRGAGYHIGSIDRLSIARTPTGRCDTLTLGSLTLDGGEVRRLFSLRSTDFDVRISGDGLSFTVRGYGHGVGMSQYGADAMARAGYGYREILAHYYSGAVVG